MVWTSDGCANVGLFGHGHFCQSRLDPLPIVLATCPAPPPPSKICINLHSLSYTEYYSLHLHGSCTILRRVTDTWYDHITGHDELLVHPYPYVLFINCVLLLRISSPAITSQSLG